MIPFRDRQAKPFTSVDILEPLSDNELEELATQCLDIRLESGEDHAYPKEYDGGLLLIKRGHVRVYKLTPMGKQLTVALLGDGAVFSAWQSQGLHIQAMESSIITYMRREILEHLIRKSPEVGLRLVNLLSERLHQSNERLSDLIHKEVPSRLANLILRLAQDEGVVTRGGYKIPTRYTHEQLGTMIGANRVAVTKALSALQDVGTVELKRRFIHIRDVDTLERVASEEK